VELWEFVKAQIAKSTKTRNQERLADEQEARRRAVG
jgi:hypothetical protein